MRCVVIISCSPAETFGEEPTTWTLSSKETRPFGKILNFLNLFRIWLRTKSPSSKRFSGLFLFLEYLFCTSTGRSLKTWFFLKNCIFKQKYQRISVINVIRVNDQHLWAPVTYIVWWLYSTKTLGRRKPKYDGVKIEIHYWWEFREQGSS